MNLETHLNPDKARSAYKVGTANYHIASLALRSLWHVIYDPCQKLLALDSPSGKAILDEFLDYADSCRYTMEWDMHLQLLDWLSQHDVWSKNITPEIAKELMIASGIRWANTPMSHKNDYRAQSIVIRTPCSDEWAVGVARNDDPRSRPKVYILKIDGKVNHTVYACTQKKGIWATQGWIKVINMLM